MHHPNDDFEVATPLGGSFLAVDFTRITSNADPSAFVAFEAGEPYLDEPGRLVGKWEIDVHPGIDYPITLRAAQAVLRLEGRDSISMDGTVAADGRSFRFNVPNESGNGRIDFIVELSDACFTYRAEGAWAFAMVRASHAAGCPADHEAMAEHFASLGEPPLQVGDLGFDLVPHEIIGLWTPYGVASQGGGGLATWDPDGAAASGQAGGVLRLAPTSSDLAISSFSASYYRRGAVLEYRLGDDLRRVFAATAEPYPDGHLDLLLPSEPGRYVADLRFRFETPCAYGGASAGVSIDVE